MNYALRLSKPFTKSQTKQEPINVSAFQDIESIETDILNKIVNNQELQSFIYPVLTKYQDVDKLEVINKEFGIDCSEIQRFDKSTKMENNMVIRIVNNINNLIVINTASNLFNYYEEVYLCNLYYDNPAYNIHYIVCKNKKQEMETLDIITDCICLNSNMENIYVYLYAYLASITTLISLYNKRADNDEVYFNYCKHFAIT